MGAGGAFTDGEKEFGASGDIPFSLGEAGAELLADGAGAEELELLVLVVGASLVELLLHPVSATTPTIMAPPAIKAIVRFT